MKNNLIRAAVIGLGNMGMAHARVYSELPGCELMAIADIDLYRLKEAQARFSCNAYPDYMEMLTKEKLDLVSIVVPTELHAQVAIGVAAYEIPFLVEKPITSTLNEALSLQAAALKRDVPFMVGHIERFNPAVIALQSLITEGEIGDLLELQTRRVGYKRPPATIDTAVDLAIHDIEICNFLAGRPPRKVLANNTENQCEALLDYGSTKANISANWLTPIKIRRLTVTSSLSYVELDYISQSVKVYKPPQTNRSLDTFSQFQQASQSKAIPIEVVSQEPLKLELEHMLEVARGETSPIVTPQQAIEALRVVLEIRKAEEI